MKSDCVAKFSTLILITGGQQQRAYTFSECCLLALHTQVVLILDCYFTAFKLGIECIEFFTWKPPVGFIGLGMDVMYLETFGNKTQC